MENIDVHIASLHAEAGQRQAALAQAIGSFGSNETPPSSTVIVKRATEFYGFLAVTPTV